MRTRMLFWGALTLAGAAHAQIPDCTLGLCSGLGAPTFACRPGWVYSQVDSTPAGATWSCSGVPPRWVVAGAGSGGAALPLASAAGQALVSTGPGSAYAPETLATVATSGKYTDLSNLPALATVATSGKYTDLSNLPTIPPAPVNPDWNATSGLAQILNKPTLGTAAAHAATDFDAAGAAAAVQAASLAQSANLSDLASIPTARANLGLAAVAVSGSYTDLINQPSVVADPGANGLVFRSGAGAARVGAYGDIVNLWTNCTSGYLMYNGACGTPSGGGAGTVTSVGLSTPGVLYSVSGSPITSSGVLSLNLLSQNAGTVFAGPVSGSAAAPSFRALAATDLPASVALTSAANTTFLGLAASQLSSNALTAPSAPTVTVTGTAGSATYAYACAAVDGVGNTTAAGSAASVTTGNATLSSSNYNAVACASVTGAASENVYRTAGGGGTGLIGNVANGGTLNDTGLTATTAAPTVNATGKQTWAGPGSFAFDSGNAPSLTFGAGGGVSNYIGFSGNRGYVGSNGSATVVQAGAGKDIEFDVSSAWNGGTIGGWTSTGVPFTQIGSSLASASTIAPSGNGVYHVTGTTQIVTITAPTGCTTGGRACELVLIPDGAWSTGTSGNIANAVTATVSQPVLAFYDPGTAKWYVK